MPPPTSGWGSQPGWPPPPERKPHRRLLLFGGIGVLVLALVAGVLTYILWPQAAESPRQMAADSVSNFTSWQGASYQGVVVDSDGVATRVQVTVTGAGEATGTLSRDFGAQADIAVDGTGTYLRGNEQWWLYDEPGSAATLANQWIAASPDEVTGLLPVKSLTPAAFSARLSGSADWKQVGQTTVNGTPGLVLSDGTQQVTVTASTPHRLLAVGVPLGSTGTSDGPSASNGPSTSEGPSASDGPTSSDDPGTQGIADRSGGRFATAVAHQHGGDGPAVSDVALADGGAAAAAEPPAAQFAVSEPTGADFNAARAAAKGLRDAQVPPKPLDQSIPVQPDVSVSVNAPDCETPVCPATVTVSNTGDGPAEGTLMVTVDGTPVDDIPVTVPPGATVPYPMSAPNLAPPGGQVMVLWMASLYVPSVMGPNPDLARNLSQRGINVNKVLAPGQPNGPPLLDVLTSLTDGVDPTKDPEGAQQQVTDAVNIINNTVRKRAFAPVHQLVTSGKLQLGGPSGLHDFAQSINNLQLGGVRELEEAARLTQQGDEVVVGTGYTPPGSATTYKADIIDLTARDAIQIKTVTGGPAKVLQNFQEAINQLKGNTGEIVPPGFNRVVQINLEPGAADGMAGLDRADLLDRLRSLRTDTPNGSLTMSGLCQSGGTPLVDRVIFSSVAAAGPGAAVASRYEFTCADFAG